MPPEVADIPDLSDDDLELVDLSRSRSTLSRSLDFTFSGHSSSTSTTLPPTRTLRSERGRQDEDNVVSRNGGNAEACFLEKCLVQRKSADNEENWVEVELSNFVIYKKGSLYAELQSLHDIALHNHEKSVKFCFDGKITHENGLSQEVASIDITGLQIDNLGGLNENLDPVHNTCSDAVYLQTKAAKRYNCFYRLQSPNSRYKSCFDNFAWLADLMKLIIDYLTWASEEDNNIGLQDFKANFVQKLQYWHHGKDVFQQWHERCGYTTDFRPHLTSANHWPFNCGQASSIEDDSIAEHRLWAEIGQPLYPTMRIEPSTQDQTLVTAHAAQCFLASFPTWGKRGYDLLEIIILDQGVAKLQTQRRRQVGLGDKPYYDHTGSFKNDGRSLVSNAASLLEKSSLQRPLRVDPQELVGNALVVRLHKNNCWARPCTCAAEYRFCVARSCFERDLRVRWLILPSRTICAGRYPSPDIRGALPFYPIGNELFWSSNCCCTTVPLHDVVASYKISIGKDHADAGDKLFVHRQHEDYGIGKNELDIRSNERSKGGDSRGKAVSLFSGCSLLDYGFQKGSGGLFDLVLAIERDEEAVLSFKANHAHVTNCEILCQDVNTVLRELCAGTRVLEETACLLAGCPCQGFSLRNVHKNSKESQKNCTLFGHTLSWVEMVSPRMVLIENVEGLDYTKPSAAGQAVSFLVSLGYQVRLVTVQASDYGAATKRKRIFIIATVPGIPLPKVPEATHGERQYQAPLVTVSSATSDLNHVDNNTMLNSRFPDHVPIEHFEPSLQAIVSKIPRTIPKGESKMPNLVSAYSELNAVEMDWFRQRTEEQKHPNKGTLRRIHPNRPYSTILTTISAMDSRSDGSVHWSVDRGVTLAELRRYQGIPDSFVLIGPRWKQIAQAGNSVAVAASMMLGKSYTESWKARLKAAESNDAGPPSQRSKVEELTDTEDEKFRPRTKAASIVLDDYDKILPEMKDLFSTTPRLKRHKSAGIAEGDAELPDLSKLLTPTKSRSEIVKTTAVTDELTITPRGSIHMTRNTKSKIFVRRRSSSSEDEIVKRPRMSFKERISVNVPKRTDKHNSNRRGHTIEDAIVLDD
ncbi:hypothetical protein LTR70_002113 [Exophiala xenobiotica]|uniref:DNA (cytosine-5-)-methyltransferase n=1 Tax=Lithohypha guttulata TaxID=1690604 RepID=A0ABR0K453_9EURO|nr:hypothetical protein LTR24_007351 [Lithohypha guttulata]KAK5326113.1 hypothetical protein LTR70_002113 [Exophiala xenobiotica]